MSNRLQYETSPYLLQHKDNPVDWYPWGPEAFERARSEDKPIFLSIGYSTCHWCHVLAHESFEDREISELLNRWFVSIKVDKEERPDVDSVYMAVCQAFTGSGGWPVSIFMTADQKPFFAGTYLPRTSRGGMPGMRELLLAIHEKWEHDRSSLLRQSEGLVTHLRRPSSAAESPSHDLTRSAAEYYKRSYDRRHGGFDRAPKFPAPHNLLFLLSYFQRRGDRECLQMAEHTLLQMYRGGLFDHIGGGFCRYSTDKSFLVPHFEKMLYDNALLITAYCRAYETTKKPLYLDIAQKTADFVLREMTSPNGGFYSAQDADSEGVEGKYYLFTPDEITGLLGQDDGERFNRRFDISVTGNFEGKNIPNLLKSEPSDDSFAPLMPLLCDYRKNRFPLHLDDKILTAWNGLMISAMSELYLVSKNGRYLSAAEKADAFIREHLMENSTLFVSFRDGKRGSSGFLDDYSSFIFAQLALYRATLRREYLDMAELLCEKVLSGFGDSAGGFYLYSHEGEELILRPKETYDGAVPSGNSLMAYNFVRLSLVTGSEKHRAAAERQLAFLATEAAPYPSGFAMFLTALLEQEEPPAKITVVPGGQTDHGSIPLSLPPDAAVFLLPRPTDEYPLKNGMTTYYICKGHTCLPPVNDLSGLEL